MLYDEIDPNMDFPFCRLETEAAPHSDSALQKYLHRYFIANHPDGKILQS